MSTNIEYNRGYREAIEMIMSKCQFKGNDIDGYRAYIDDALLKDMERIIKENYNTIKPVFINDFSQQETEYENDVPTEITENQL